MHIKHRYAYICLYIHNTHTHTHTWGMFSLLAVRTSFKLRFRSVLPFLIFLFIVVAAHDLYSDIFPPQLLLLLLLLLCLLLYLFDFIPHYYCYWCSWWCWCWGWDWCCLLVSFVVAQRGVLAVIVFVCIVVIEVPAIVFSLPLENILQT